MSPEMGKRGGRGGWQDAALRTFTPIPMKHLVPLLGALACTVAQAAPVYLETPVTYAPNAGIVDKVKEECKPDEMFAREASPFFAKLSQGEGTVAADAATRDQSRVRVQITHVMGVGGGAWSGPKSMSIEATLVENGKAVRTTKLTRSTTGGAFGGFKGTCSLVERCAKALGKDVAQWANDPQYRGGD